MLVVHKRHLTTTTPVLPHKFFQPTQVDPRTVMNGRGSFLTLLFGIPFAPELTKSWPYELGGSAGISHMGSLAQKILTFAANLVHSG